MKDLYWIEIAPRDNRIVSKEEYKAYIDRYGDHSWTLLVGGNLLHHYAYQTEELLSIYRND